MGLLDDIKGKVEDVAQDPQKREKAEQAARDFAEKHNLSIEEAKKKLSGK